MAPRKSSLLRVSLHAALCIDLNAYDIISSMWAEKHGRTTILSRTIIKRRILAIGLGILYYAVFLVCYWLLIVPTYAYTGLTFRVLPLWCWVISVVLALIPMLWMPLDIERPSDLASWFLYLCLILPSNVVMFMVSAYEPVEVLPLPVTLCAAFALFDFLRRTRRFKITTITGSGKLFTIALPLITILLAFAVFRLAGFKFNLSFNEVYDRRLEAREIIPGGSFMGYALSFLKSICIPLLVGIGIQWKKWSYILIAIFGVVTIFSLNAMKAALAQPIILAGVVMLVIKKKENIGLLITTGFICITLLSLLEAVTFGTIKIATFLIRREMAVPGMLTTYYWEYFSHNPYVFMADSFIGKILSIHSPYDMPTSRLIGLVFFGNPESNVNANIWASAFANFGYFGFVMVSILAALILRLADSLSTKGKFEIGCACCSAIGLVWVNGALHTSMITNGVAGLILALWLFPSQRSLEQ